MGGRRARTGVVARRGLGGGARARRRAPRRPAPVRRPADHRPRARWRAVDDEGFIVAGEDARVEGCERTWAAGDGVVSPIKFGGLATHQARRAAAAIARLAGVDDAPDPGEPVIHGRLLVGRRMRRLRGRGDAEGAPLWWPQGKVAGEYLPRWLSEHQVTPPAVNRRPGDGVTVNQPLSRMSGREEQVPVRAVAPIPHRRPGDRLAGPPDARGARALSGRAGRSPLALCGSDHRILRRSPGLGVSPASAH